MKQPNCLALFKSNGDVIYKDAEEFAIKLGQDEANEEESYNAEMQLSVTVNSSSK